MPRPVYEYSAAHWLVNLARFYKAHGRYNKASHAAQRARALVRDARHSH